MRQSDRDEIIAMAKMLLDDDMELDTDDKIQITTDEDGNAWVNCWMRIPNGAPRVHETGKYRGDTA